MSSKQLPDVAFEQAAFARPLDWVGMDHIAIPVRITDNSGQLMQVPADANVAVNLVDTDARGIHMSRLYLQLQHAFTEQALTPQRLHDVVAACLSSQQGSSTQARLQMQYSHLLLRHALASDNAGWKAYPVTVEGVVSDSGFELRLGIVIEYSSTCPASAALSRQVNARAFAKAFADKPLSVDEIHDWLRSPAGQAATPHAQRSTASLNLKLNPRIAELPIVEIIDQVEDALGTPVQTAVKREDEQAFAERNAENLMFCEDAARRVAAVLSRHTDIVHFDATLEHLESLHAHDAVARVSGKGGAAI